MSAAGNVWSITRSTFDGSYSLSILISFRERIASGPVLSCAIARSTLTTAMSPAIDNLAEEDLSLWLLVFWLEWLLFMFIAFSANVIESSFNILVAVPLCDEVNDQVFIVIIIINPNELYLFPRL